MVDRSLVTKDSLFVCLFEAQQGLAVEFLEFSIEERTVTEYFSLNLTRYILPVSLYLN